MALPSYEEYQKQFEERKAQQEAELAQLGYKRVGNKYIKVPTEQEAYSDQLTTMSKEQSYLEGTPEGIKSKAMAEAEAKAAAEQKYPTKTAKTDSVELRKFEGFSKSGMRALDNIEKRMKENPLAYRLNALTGGIYDRQLNSYMTEAMDALARIRTGAALTKEEQKLYKNQLPGFFDNAEDAKVKLNNFRAAFEQAASQKRGEAQSEETPDYGAKYGF